MTNQKERFENDRLENLSRHRGLRDSGLSQVPNLRTHSPHAEFPIALADLFKCRVGMTFDGNASDFVTLSDQRLSNADWEVSPAGDESNFLWVVHLVAGGGVIISKQRRTE